MATDTTMLSEEEYLALERAAEFKSEFLDGEIVAMAGGTRRHTDLQVNLIAALHAALTRHPVPSVQLRFPRPGLPQNAHLSGSVRGLRRTARTRRGYPS